MNLVQELDKCHKQVIHNLKQEAQNGILETMGALSLGQNNAENVGTNYGYVPESYLPPLEYSPMYYLPILPDTVTDPSTDALTQQNMLAMQNPTMVQILQQMQATQTQIRSITLTDQNIQVKTGDYK